MEWVMIGICVVIAIIPPRYDPAVRLKLWLEARRK